ncbi:hypothetical protein CEUSTIGMA_g13507.t1 [Chlamydomonas eustigma]|uniref:Uncharacterized protein n=1 Tax=Chlamydomonas eustigma TaxID=1157962 RepID=A0A250XSQ3_9CHLO|nr:hypothetical protein CEUSTIGMA_g13507.t1 [Chlamydomonas eustigma]|eukprot:GAX86094.1 hypothetical protein CEUSTIGMA_g13507.t1 [Chlamydomonas eustigma]
MMQAYTLGPSQLEFEITVSATIPLPSASSTTISPSSMAVNNVSGSGQQVLPSGSLPLSSPLTGMNGTNSSSSGTSSGGSNNTAYVLHEEQLSLSPSVPLAVTASGLLSINLVVLSSC